MVKDIKETTALAVRGQKNLITVFAERYNIDPSELKNVLKSTIMKPGKDGKGITDEELMAFLVVANQYHLNPFTKEIYAYPDTKKGGIVPVVSTDGWNKLMTTHIDYKDHKYQQSETMVNMTGAKPCPEWMEVHITKKDGGEIVVREYLDECFRTLDYSNPWKTHTKRMLRHKTKIQGAREAFGFGGIYDEDEAERIREAEVVTEIQMPKRISEKVVAVEPSKIENKLEQQTPKEEPKIVHEPEIIEKEISMNPSELVTAVIGDGRRYPTRCEVFDTEGVIYLASVDQARYAHNNKGATAQFEFTVNQTGPATLISLKVV